MTRNAYGYYVGNRVFMQTMSTMKTMNSNPRWDILAALTNFLKRYSGNSTWILYFLPSVATTSFVLRFSSNLIKINT